MFCYQQHNDVFSKSFVSTMRFTIKEKHRIIRFWVSKKYGAICLRKMFSVRKWSFYGLKHWSEKMAALTPARVVVNHTLHAKLQRFKKCKIRHLFSWPAHQDFNLCQKTFSASVLLYAFTHPEEFNKMFVFNSKSHCSNNTSAGALFTLLLAKNI